MQKSLDQPQNSNPSTAERILTTARIHFSRKGYNGASIREIAREANISIATLYYYAKNKDDLYRQVFENVYQEEIDTINSVLEKADENITSNPATLREFIFNLMDALIDRSSKDPDLIRLWAQRWIDKPEQSDYIDKQYSAPLYKMIESIIEKAEANGIINPDLKNISLVLHSFTWLHYSFFSMGRLTYGVQVDDPYDPRQLEDFREYIRIFVSRMLRFSDQN